MIKYFLAGLCLLCLLNICAYANSLRKPGAGHKQEVGMGLRAIIGGLPGGPPGAIVGAAGGVWFGSRDDRKDEAGNP